MNVYIFNKINKIKYFSILIILSISIFGHAYFGGERRLDVEVSGFGHGLSSPLGQKMSDYLKLILKYSRIPIYIVCGINKYN